jgi:argininosuccinate lyase
MMESTEKHQNVLLPGYTIYKSRCPLWHVVFHLCESLIDDITMLNAADGCGQNPLGSAAGYGEFVPDRQNAHHKSGLLKYNQCRCGK